MDPHLLVLVSLCVTLNCYSFTLPVSLSLNFWWSLVFCFVFVFLLTHSNFLKMFAGNCVTLTNTSTLTVRMTARYEGGVASYECVSNNYTLIGPSTRQCLSDGNWNGITPSCISKSILKLTYHISTIRHRGYYFCYCQWRPLFKSCYYSRVEFIEDTGID